MNQLGLVGRLVRTPEVREVDGKRKTSWVTLAITRGFKSVAGEYETDFIDILLFDNVAENTARHCRKGDVISVRGRLQSRIIEKNGEKRYVLEVIGERVTFISHVRRLDSEVSEESFDEDDLHQEMDVDTDLEVNVDDVKQKKNVSKKTTLDEKTDMATSK